MPFETPQPAAAAEPNSEDKLSDLELAEGMVQEIMPRLEKEFPLLLNKVNEYLENGFSDDPLSDMERILRIMDERDAIDQADLAQRMELIAQRRGQDGENVFGGGTPQYVDFIIYRLYDIFRPKSLQLPLK